MEIKYVNTKCIEINVKKTYERNIKQYRHADYCNPVQVVI